MVDVRDVEVLAALLAHTPRAALLDQDILPEPEVHHLLHLRELVQLLSLGHCSWEAVKEKSSLALLDPLLDTPLQDVEDHRIREELPLGRDRRHPRPELGAALDLVPD